MTTLPCIVCGGDLISALPEDLARDINQPADGLAFTTTGHYGSTVFDPGDGTMLEINVCDTCVSYAVQQGHARELRTRAAQEEEPEKR